MRSKIARISNINNKSDKLVESEFVCYLCRSSEKDDRLYGEIFNRHISGHYFCLLLSSGLAQNAKSTSMGIFGFLKNDIVKEANRVKNLRCHYCQKPSANIGCCMTRCRRTFHTTCAEANGCLTQFIDPYQSFCHDHVECGGIGDGPKHVNWRGGRLDRIKATPNGFCTEDHCSICFDAIGEFHLLRTIRMPCCKNWFHRDCLRGSAQMAGYLFKCPLCNNEDVFRKTARLFGVFVPDRDALWEKQDAYPVREDECQADQCLCPAGRKNSNRAFQFVCCTHCGSCSVHSKCLSADDTNAPLRWNSNGRRSGVYECMVCIEIMQKPTAAVERPVQENSQSDLATGASLTRETSNVDPLAEDSSDETSRPVVFCCTQTNDRVIEESVFSKCSPDDPELDTVSLNDLRYGDVEPDILSADNQLLSVQRPTNQPSDKPKAQITSDICEELNQNIFDTEVASEVIASTGILSSLALSEDCNHANLSEIHSNDEDEVKVRSEIVVTITEIDAVIVIDDEDDDVIIVGTSGLCESLPSESKSDGREMPPVEIISDRTYHKIVKKRRFDSSCSPAHSVCRVPSLSDGNECNDDHKSSAHQDDSCVVTIDDSDEEQTLSSAALIADIVSNAMAGGNSHKRRRKSRELCGCRTCEHISCAYLKLRRKF